MLGTQSKGFKTRLFFVEAVFGQTALGQWEGVRECVRLGGGGCWVRARNFCSYQFKFRAQPGGTPGAGAPLLEWPKITQSCQVEVVEFLESFP